MTTATCRPVKITIVKMAASERWFSDILPSCGFPREILDGKHHPCPKCGGKDRFRAIDSNTGTVLCNQCFHGKNGDGFTAITWFKGLVFRQSFEVVATYLGMRVCDEDQSKLTNIVERVAELKRIPLASFIAFGAHEALRGRINVARLPMYDEKGQQCSHCDFAELNDNFRKGLSAKGKPTGLYYANRPAPGETILITEGPKDAGALHSLGYNVVGLPTCKLAKKFSGVFKGCHVIIVPDLDEAGKASAPITASRLNSTAASIRIAWLPGDVKASDGDGVREILAKNNGETQVRLAIDNSVPWQPGDLDSNSSPGSTAQATMKVVRTSQLGAQAAPNGTGDTLQTSRDSPSVAGSPYSEVFEFNDPRRLALLFLERRCTAGDYKTVVKWNSEWYWWNSVCYETIETEGLRARLVNFVQKEFEATAIEQLQRYKAQPKKDGDEGGPKAEKVTQALLNNVLQHFSAITHIGSAIKQPSWLWHEPNDFDSRENIVAKNGIINLRKLVSGDPEYRVPPTPAYFSTNCLPFDFDETAADPIEWLRFLNELWPNDSDSILCLQEWFGLLLVPDTRFQKVLLVVGPKRSGKGTIARVIRALIGESNVAGPTLAGLATNFGLWPLIGKQVAIIADARLSSQTDSAVVTERLLSISGEDGITIDRKNLAPLTTTLSTRFVLMTNELPRLTDASNALAARFVILRMENSFIGKEDHGLTERLIKELPLILTWAISGWQRLNQNGRFTIPESSQDLVNQLEDSSSPVGAFVRECCDVGAEFEIEKKDLFTAWKSWCETENRAHPGILSTFATQLRAAVSSVSAKRAQVFGARIQQYTGIKLK